MNSIGKITRVKNSDPRLEKIKWLDQHQFPRPWSEKSWTSMDWEMSVLYSFEIDGEVVGFALFHHVPGDDSAHLLKICLETNLRGGGHSIQFWSLILDQLALLSLKSVFLEVEVSNLQAIGFYLKNNFKKLRTIKNFYSNGVDAITMLLTM